MSLWIPSPNKYTGRRSSLKWIVWHSTEGPEVTGAAYNVGAGWFGKTSSGVSAHIVADSGQDSRYRDGIVECVKPADTAWHCGNANASGYGIEVVGYASQGTSQWSDAYSLAAVRNACSWVKTNPATSGIPRRWLTDAQVRAGEAGHVTHAQVARVLGGSSHTDPGNCFPYAYVMQQLTGSSGVVNPSNPTIPVQTGGQLVYGSMNNPAVRELQAFLRRVFPSYASNLPATGNYLDQTKQVVAEFQRRAGVTGSDADGSIVGPRTVTALRRFGYTG